MYSIPTIGLGTWKSTNPQELIDAIIYSVKEAGIVHIDCAFIYGNEKEVGEALKKLFEMGIKRDQLWITSKLWNTHHSCVEEACRATLKNLQLDYLDLYLMHHATAFESRPIGGEPFPLDANGHPLIDKKRSFIDTYKDMEKLVDLGLVRHIGVSNFTINHLERLKHSGVRIKPYTNQVEFHLYYQQKPMRNYLHDEGILLTGYSTLGTPDSPLHNFPPLLKDEVLVEIAKEVGKSPAEVALRFLHEIEPSASLLTKSVTPSHIMQNAHLNFDLTPEQVDRLIKRDKCVRYCGLKERWDYDEQGDGW